MAMLRLLMEETMSPEEAVVPFQGDIRSAPHGAIAMTNISDKVLIHLSQYSWPSFLRQITYHTKATPEVLAAVIDSHIANYIFDQKTFRRLTTQPVGKSRYHIARPTLQRDHNHSLNNVEAMIMNNPSVPEDAIQRLVQAYEESGAKYSIRRVNNVIEKRNERKSK